MPSVELYQELISDIGEIIKFVTIPTFPTQFDFNDLNEDCYNEIYQNETKTVVRRNEYFSKINNLENTCKNCWPFYLNPRTRSIKGLDIQLGKKFEEKFCEFLKKKEIRCEGGDTKDKKFPDKRVKDEKDNIKAYLEVKYQSAPWIFAFKEHGTNRECYEGSPALDTKKLEQQWNLIEDGKIKCPIYYVFWLDFPCIKGVFFIDMKDMYRYYKEEAKIFERKVRDGDYVKGKDVALKVGHIAKIHPSIYQMRPFEELIEILR